MKIGDKVRVSVVKSGYWYNYKYGIVTNITAKRISVKALGYIRSYLPTNVKKIT